MLSWFQDCAIQTCKYMLFLMVLPGAWISDLVLVAVERLTRLRPPHSIMMALASGYLLWFCMVGLCVVPRICILDTTSIPPLEVSYSIVLRFEWLDLLLASFKLFGFACATLLVWICWSLLLLVMHPYVLIAMCIVHVAFLSSTN